MCYSALIQQHLKNLGIRYKARIDLALFASLIDRRTRGEKITISRSLEASFTVPKTAEERRIKEAIDRYREGKTQETETDLFAQKKRLADAERKLKAKFTKTAEKEKQIAERKIETLKRRLERLTSEKPLASDSRIYPMDWAPVLIWREGERVIVPMRYHLRPPGAPEDFDRQYPGCYNARKDSLPGFWRREFGKKHAVLIMTSFFENVKNQDSEENRVLQFFPKDQREMIVACIWDEWSGKSSHSLQSFALITDEPPREIAEAGHNRCPNLIRESNIDAWLQPEGKTDEELFEILGDRDLPYFEHQVAA